MSTAGAAVSHQFDYLAAVVSEENGSVEVAVSGEFDAYTAPRLQEELARLCGAEHRRVVVDLSSTTFIDAAGVAALVAARTHCHKGGGWLHVRSPSPFASRVLEMTGLTGLLAPDPAAARPPAAAGAGLDLSADPVA